MEKRPRSGHSPEVLASRKTPRIGVSSFQTFDDHPTGSAQSSRRLSLSRSSPPETMVRHDPRIHTPGVRDLSVHPPANTFREMFPKALDAFVRATSRHEQRVWQRDAAQKDYDEMVPKCKAFPAIHSQIRNRRGQANADFDKATLDWNNANDLLQDALEALEIRLKSSERNGSIASAQQADSVTRVEFKSLQSRLAESERQYQEVSKRLERSESDVKRLEVDLNRASSDAREAVQAQTRLASCVQMSEDAMSSDIRKVEERAQQDRKGSFDLKAQVLQHREKLATQTDLIELARTELEKQSALLDALQKQPEVEKTVEPSPDMIKTAEKLYDAVFGRGGDDKGLVKDVSELSKELYKSKTRIDVELFRIEEENKEKDEYVNHENEEMRSDIASLGKKMEDTHANIASSGKKMEDLHLGLASLGKNMEDMHIRISDLLQRNDAHTTAMGSLETRFNNLTTDDMVRRMVHQFECAYGPAASLKAAVDHMKTVDARVNQCFQGWKKLSEQVQYLGRQRDAQTHGNVSYLDRRLQYLDEAAKSLKSSIDRNGEIIERVAEDLRTHKAQGTNS